MFRTILVQVVAIVLMTTVLAIPALAVTPTDSVGVVDQTQGLWYLRDSGSGATTSFYFGNPGDYPIMGDWDCDGIDTPGLYRQSDGYVYLRNSNTQGIANIRFFFGNPGDIPLRGRFQCKDGCDTVSIYRPSQARIFIINELGANDGGLGAADFDFYFGNPGDEPFTGDFNDNGEDTVGLHRESTGFVYYRDTLTTGIADNDFFFGNPGDQILTGRWAQNPTAGPDTVGIFRPTQGQFYLRFSNTQGNADVDFPYGNSDMAAVAGTFAPPPFQVLVFHRTRGFRHDSIPAGIAAITELGQEYGFAVTSTADASVFTDSDLAGYAVIVFLSTTGDVLDGEQERALERFIEAGNGFVGIHSAAGTEYEWPWYGSLIGAYFDSHPAPQQALIQVVEPQHPAMQGLPRTFVRFDEWYNFRNQPDSDVMILATLDESSYEGGTMGKPHPIVWARQYEEGGTLVLYRLWSHR